MPNRPVEPWEAWLFPGCSPDYWARSSLPTVVVDQSLANRWAIGLPPARPDVHAAAQGMLAAGIDKKLISQITTLPLCVIEELEAALMASA